MYVDTESTSTVTVYVDTPNKKCFRLIYNMCTSVELFRSYSRGRAGFASFLSFFPPQNGGPLFLAEVGPNKYLAASEFLPDWPQIWHVERGDDPGHIGDHAFEIGCIVFELDVFQN